MMHMNLIGNTALEGGVARAFGPGTCSFGTPLSGRFPASA